MPSNRLVSVICKITRPNPWIQSADITPADLCLSCVGLLRRELRLRFQCFDGCMTVIQAVHGLILHRPG
jgi:hypothetical protein